MGRESVLEARKEKTEMKLAIADFNLSEHTKGVLSLIGLTVVWSLAALLPRFLATSFALLQQIYLRFFFALLASAIFFRKKINYRKILSSQKKDLLPIFLRAFFYYLFGVGLFTKAVLTTKISNVSFIGVIPVTAILGFLIFKEKVTFKKLSLVLLSFLGAIFISVKDYSHLFTFGKGELFAFLSAIFVSFGMLIRKWETKYLNTYESSFLVIFFAVIIMLTTSLIFGEGLPLTNWNLPIIGALIIAGLINVAIVIFITYGFSRVKAILASNLIQLEAPITVTLAYLIFHEFPNLREAIGGLVILTSAYLMNKLETKS